MKIELQYDPVRPFTNICIDGVNVSDNDPYSFLYPVRHYPFQTWVKESSRFKGLKESVADYARGEDTTIVFRGDKAAYRFLVSSESGLKTEFCEWQQPDGYYDELIKKLDDTIKDIIAPLRETEQMTSCEFIESVISGSGAAVQPQEKETGEKMEAEAEDRNAFSMAEFISVGISEKKNSEPKPAPLSSPKIREVEIPFPDLIAAGKAILSFKDESSSWLTEIRAESDIRCAKKIPDVCCLLFEMDISDMDKLMYSFNRAENAIACVVSDSEKRQLMRSVAAEGGKAYYIIPPEDIDRTKALMWEEYGKYYKDRCRMRVRETFREELIRAVQQAAVNGEREQRWWSIEREEQISRFFKLINENITN